MVWDLFIQLKSKLAHLVLTALKTVGHLYENCTRGGPNSFFLYSQYEMLPSGRRYSPYCAN